MTGRPAGATMGGMRTRLALVAAVVAAAVVKLLVLERLVRNWGARPAEVDRSLPGDELLAAPAAVSTRAIFIDAPPEKVWPWLVQMGQDRGGFYSYDGLERLFGLDVHNADSIVPDWQTLAVGDVVRLAPEATSPDAAFVVRELDPPDHLLLVAGEPEQGKGATWVLQLDRTAGGGTHLIARTRLDFGIPGPLAWPVTKGMSLAHFVMERRQLIGIRERAMGPAVPVAPASGPAVSPV